MKSLIKLFAWHGKSHLLLSANVWICTGFMYLFVKVFIPHVIDGAARSSHQQSTCTKQGEHAQMWETAGVRSQSNAPSTREIQQPRPCTDTLWAKGANNIEALLFKTNSWPCFSFCCKIIHHYVLHSCRFKLYLRHKYKGKDELMWSLEAQLTLPLT